MYQWSLNEIYPGFESTAFQADWETFQSIKASFQSLELVDQLAGVRQAVDLLEDYGRLSRRLFTYMSLRLSTDTGDQEATKYRTLASKVAADLSPEVARVRRFLGTSQVDLSQDEKLSQYSFFFEECRQGADHLMADEVEEVVAKLGISGGQTWVQLFDHLTASVEGTYQGQAITLSQVRNLAYDGDSQVRKEAYQVEQTMYQSVKDPIAFALNAIKNQVTTVAKLRGYASPLDQTLQNARMTRQTLDALLGAIQDYLPSFRKYLRHKGKLLGYDNGLPFYELFAPIGKSSANFTIEESRDFLIQQFADFSQDLAEMTAEAYDNAYIDFLPKKGKVGGAFCNNLTFIKQSRILTNFGGSLSDVVTLAHELGHAYHGLHIQDHLPLNQSYTMPVAETASIFNENLVMNRLIAQADQDSAVNLIESQLQDMTQVIVDIYSRYLFETSVFQKGQEGFLFAKDLEDLMLEAQDQAYGDGLDPDYRHPYMWACKPHYYSTGLSFYNFPYAFGGLFSLGLYAIYQEEAQGFVDRYQALLKATTIGSVEDTAKVMGIDVTQKEFWAKALEQVAKKIDDFIDMTPVTE